MLGHSAVGASALGEGARQSGGVLDAIFAPAFAVAITGTVAVTGAVDASFAPVFSAEITGTVEVIGALDASFSPSFVVEVTGDGGGNPIVIPRDIADGIAYLLEIEAYDYALDEVVTLTYSSGGFVSLPTDPISNRTYDAHIDVPGDYERFMFGEGGTAGDIRVGAGVVRLKNIDDSLSALDDYGFDGRSLTIKTVARLNPLYENAVTVFRGTMSHAELRWGEINLLIRDRLALLDKPLQETLYAGTTVAGGMDEAEGQPDDLKGRPKPLTLGAPQNVQAVPSNVFDRVYDLHESALSAAPVVRDKGVILTAFGTSYTTLAGLLAAAVPEGFVASAPAIGKVKLGSEPVGQVTASPVAGATAADRTAAQIARQIMLRMGLVEDVDFLSADVAALDALNDAEIGYWISAEEQTALVAISRVLNSIGASCAPDRLGVFRLYRFDAAAPDAFPVAVFTEDVILEGTDGIERLGTGDRGSGVPSWRIIVNYGHNGAVMSAADLDPEELPLTDPFRAFAGEEWRKATAEDAAVKVAHLLSPELTFDTYLIHEADAQAEAERRLALYGVKRERYRIKVKSFLAEPVDLNSVVELRINRFRLSAGKKFRVIGIEENFETGTTTLDIWG